MDEVRAAEGGRENLWFIFSDLIKFIAGELNFRLMDISLEWRKLNHENQF